MMAMIHNDSASERKIALKLYAKYRKASVPDEEAERQCKFV